MTFVVSWRNRERSDVMSPHETAQGYGKTSFIVARRPWASSVTDLTVILHNLTVSRKPDNMQFTMMYFM